jgi:hypothetical protein
MKAIALLLLSTILVACGGPENGGDGSGSNSDSFLPTPSVKCGGSVSCFSSKVFSKGINSAVAENAYKLVDETLLPLITDMNEEVGEALIAAGYSACDDVPLSGTKTVTDDDGNTMGFTFLASAVSHPFNTGGTFDKHIQVSYNSSQFMDLHFSCGSELIGRLKANYGAFSGMSNLRVETWYYQDTGDNEAYASVYMTYNDGTAKSMMVNFTSTNVNDFNMWIAYDDNTGNAPTIDTDAQNFGMSVDNSKLRIKLANTNSVDFSTDPSASIDEICESSGSVVACNGTFPDIGDLTDGINIEGLNGNTSSASQTAWSLQKLQAISLDLI